MAILILLITLGACYFVLYPSFQNEPTYVGVSMQTSSPLHDQRERCLQVLRDLELDQATGKVNGEEYARMRAAVGKELLAIVDQLKTIAG